MFNASNSKSVLIGKSIARTATVQVYDSSAASFLADGEVVVINKNGAALTAGQTIADSEYIRIAQRSGATAATANVIYSPKIYGANVTAFSGLSYVAPAEQVTYVGFNGTSGAIEAISDNVYKLRITFKHDMENWSEQSNVLYNEVTSDASATASEVAAAFVDKYNTTYPAQNADIKVERVTDGTFTVLGGSATVDVTKGSPTVTASSASHALVAGDIVRIGATSATTPVYLVSAVSGVTITLDSNYTGDTATVANANVGEMSAVTAWGLKITGRALTTTIATFKYLKVAFDVTIQNFGTSTVTDSQAASRGNGTYEQIAELEYFARGYDGWLSTRNAVPAVAQPNVSAVSGAIYDTINIKAFDNSDFGVISGSKPAPFEITIALVDGASQATNILAQLNPWMASTSRAFSNVSL